MKWLVEIGKGVYMDRTTREVYVVDGGHSPNDNRYRFPLLDTYKSPAYQSLHGSNYEENEFHVSLISHIVHQLKLATEVKIVDEAGYMDGYLEYGQLKCQYVAVVAAVEEEFEHVRQSMLGFELSRPPRWQLWTTDNEEMK